jgi:hypothetical protein
MYSMDRGREPDLFLSSEYQTMDKVQNSVIQIAIHHRQNPLKLRGREDRYEGQKYERTIPR